MDNLARDARPQRSNGAHGRVLVVDDHAPARQSIADILRQSRHEVELCASAVEALALVQREGFDVIITDLQMPGMSGLDFIRRLECLAHGAQIVMITAHATVASAVEAMRRGAFDYVEKPFDADRLERLVARALAHGRLLDRARVQPAVADGGYTTMIGDSRPMRELRERIARVAPTTETILITGESGTGKELVARAVHAASPRARAPLVSVNCPVLSAHLLESELFGHEKGAFTGADAARAGRFELADGGTILLDEVTEIGLPVQSKLLRVLQEKTFERVGASVSRRVDVRVMATTNRDLPAEIAAERFRDDLYYRLAVVPLSVPPLRDRADDVPPLIAYFLDRSAARLKKDPCVLDPSGHELLIGYHWPGNVRELENIITRASVLNQGSSITADELRPWLIEGRAADRRAVARVPVGLSLHEMERKLIEATLDRFAGHRARTARALGIGLRTLSGKLKEYGHAPRNRRVTSAI
ncbi:MAG: sigma-54-dependent Fis family transcriptional regulator [Planctomycetia bacterium]|nr:sigma-54-dependent Fis family transcriptional regulator [Planctomycetia bacterium]